MSYIPSQQKCTCTINVGFYPGSSQANHKPLFSNSPRQPSLVELLTVHYTNSNPNTCTHTYHFWVHQTGKFLQYCANRWILVTDPAPTLLRSLLQQGHHSSHRPLFRMKRPLNKAHMFLILCILVRRQNFQRWRFGASLFHLFWEGWNKNICLIQTLRPTQIFEFCS